MIPKKGVLSIKVNIVLPVSFFLLFCFVLFYFVCFVCFVLFCLVLSCLVLLWGLMENRGLTRVILFNSKTITQSLVPLYLPTSNLQIVANCKVWKSLTRLLRCSWLAPAPAPAPVLAPPVTTQRATGIPQKFTVCFSSVPLFLPFTFFSFFRFTSLANN